MRGWIVSEGDLSGSILHRCQRVVQSVLNVVFKMLNGEFGVSRKCCVKHCFVFQKAFCKITFLAL